MSDKLQTKAPAETAASMAELQALSDTLPDFLAKHDKPLPDCTTDDGMESAKASQKALKGIRDAATEHHEKAKAFYLKNGRIVDAMKNDIIAKAEPIEAKYKAAIKVVRDEEKRIEAERIQKLKDAEEAMQKRFDEINAMHQAITLDDINAAIEKLNNLDLQAFQDRADEAIEKSEQALEWLTKRKAELEEQKAESDRIEAEREKLRKEQEAIEAERKAEADKLQAEKDKLAQERQALADEKEKQERAALVAEEQRKAQIAADKRAEDQRKQAEIDKKEAAEKAAQVERERIENERVAAEKKEAAEKAEAERIARNAPDAEKLDKWLTLLSGMKMPDMSTTEGNDAVEKIEFEFVKFIVAAKSHYQSLKTNKAA